jgi:hypothetical protein
VFLSTKACFAAKFILSFFFQALTPIIENNEHSSI